MCAPVLENVWVLVLLQPPDQETRESLTEREIERERERERESERARERECVCVCVCLLLVVVLVQEVKSEGLRNNNSIITSLHKF